MTSLWTPTTVGNVRLPHRLALAPMTRSRANADGTPSDLVPTYYAQRASLGLLITEGVQPSEDGQGYMMTPGIHSSAQVEGWKKVTAAVHAKGGHMFMQLMHAGRMSHPDNTPHHRQPVAPSALSAGQQMFTPAGMQDTPVPRALTTEEVGQTVEDFRKAARNAIDAGMDGVEIHGANGYLINQFLAPNANIRTDRYGGSIEKRARLAIEIATAIAEEIGPERTAIRLSPGLDIGGLVEGPDGPELYRYLIGELDRLNLAYLHVFHFGSEQLLKDIRALWSQKLLVLRPGRTLDTLATDIETGLADVVPVGRWGLANPDFAERLRQGAPLNEPDANTFYSSGAAGYTDYPTLQPSQSAVA
ncbi:alkene reductase [Rhizobium sp. KVB221]|uniref:Alkene reductase n=1 Tax=Rhizobium setariae TaxID=2801340 RepID=A0A937CNU5_9HYPH|nr:alkene reductase [Rhizobium setariae]MBL0371618.1 alkene reductase [Rhizobium setariae]